MDTDDADWEETWRSQAVARSGDRPQRGVGRPATTEIYFFAAAKCFLMKSTVPIGSPPPWR
jgi:hypothetical protein